MSQQVARAAPPTVVRFAEIAPDWESSPDARDEGHHRAVYRYIGGPRDAGPKAALPGWDFANGVVMAPPQNGAPLHSHGFEEVFMVWSGAFEVFWVDAREGEVRTVTLGPYDAIRMARNVMRGYRNCGDADGFLYYMHGRGAYEAPVFSADAGAAAPSGGGAAGGSEDAAPLGQVVRHDECPMNFQVYHEASLPEGVRGIRRYAGHVGGELASVGPPPSLPEGEVSFVINENRVGSGAPLHDHPDLEEAFIPLEGTWTLFWLDAKGDAHQEVLDPWDMCWAPPGVQRGFRNSGRGWGKLHVVQGRGGALPPAYHQDYSRLKN